jgi:hypothetical protein
MNSSQFDVLAGGGEPNAGAHDGEACPCVAFRMKSDRLSAAYHG